MRKNVVLIEVTEEELLVNKLNETTGNVLWACKTSPALTPVVFMVTNHCYDSELKKLLKLNLLYPAGGTMLIGRDYIQLRHLLKDWLSQDVPTEVVLSHIVTNEGSVLFDSVKGMAYGCCK